MQQKIKFDKTDKAADLGKSVCDNKGWKQEVFMMQIQCECGGELRYEYTTVVIFKQAKILSDGTLSNRRSEAFRKTPQDWHDQLTCQSCGNQYEFHADLKTNGQL